MVIISDKHIKKSLDSMVKTWLNGNQELKNEVDLDALHYINEVSIDDRDFRFYVNHYINMTRYGK